MSRGLAVSWLLFLAAQAAAVAAGLLPAGDGLLFDPDCYARLLKIKQLLDTGRWYESGIAALNGSAGLSMHWTRPLDLLILALALPLSLLLDQSAALFWAGSAVSPLLGLAAIGVLHRGLGGVVGEAAFVLAMGFLAIQRGVLQAFAWGRPDHHSLIIFLLAATLALLARSPLDGGDDRRRMAGLGAVGALGLWVSLESLLAVLACLIALGLAGLRHGGGALDNLARYGRALALGVAVALVLERPPGEWLAIELDRLSVVHLLLTGLMAAAASVLALARPSDPVRRLGVGLALALAAAAAMALAVPEFFRGPFAQVGPVARRLLVERVTELQPIWSGGWGGVLGSLIELSGLPAALVAVAWGWRAEDAPRRILARAHAAGLLVFLPAALHVVRESASLQLLCALPAGQLCLLAGRRGLARWRAGRAVAGLALGGGGFALAFGGLLLALLLHLGRWQGLHLTLPQYCRYQAVAALGREVPGTIMVFPLEDGPAAAWATGRAAVGGPYHRNEDGIRDTMAFFGALAPDGEAVALARSRAVGLVLVCTRRSIGGVDPRRLVARLARGEVPAWLQAATGPRAAGDDLRVFEAR